MIGKSKDLLCVLQKFLTCEGHYSLTFPYHIRLLLHFESSKLINFPYYFLKILEKMAKGVQKGKSNQAACRLYNYGLITILVKKELEARSMNWEELLKEFWARSIEKSTQKKSAEKLTQKKSAEKTDVGLEEECRQK